MRKIIVECVVAYHLIDTLLSQVVDFASLNLKDSSFLLRGYNLGMLWINFNVIG